MIYLEESVFNLPDDGLPGLRAALQTAIELEHATIPPYLYAMYSLRPGGNERVYDILRSVVLEEMLHMSLCCNILNAIGGAPVLDKPDFLPAYPGALPGSVGDVEIPLAPISKVLVKYVFMNIEEPEVPLKVKAVAAAPGGLTIGQFYAKIKEKLAALSLGQNIFTGDESRQLTNGYGPGGLTKVTDLTSATEAIDLIVEQGEGTSTAPFANGELGHYYQFESIYKGFEYLPPSDPSRLVDKGPPIPLQPAGIINLVTNPSPEMYQGTKAVDLNNAFNTTYTQLLKRLHDTFNGQPDQIYSATRLMRQLTGDAAALTAIQLNDGTYAGPTFTYTP